MARRSGADRSPSGSAFEPLEARVLLGGGAVLTEFLAANDSVLADEDGDFSDWIEIYNPTGAGLEMAGWHLTDDASDLGKWAFPSHLLDAEEHLVVFASGKDRAGTGPGGELHTNFRLDADGEYLALVEPDGETIASEFAPQFPPQRTDVSFGLGWEVLEGPLVAQGDAAKVLIPADDSLGLSWTGDPAHEPFDDSEAAGWMQLATGVGYDVEADCPAHTEAIGNATVDRPNLDAAIGSLFVLESDGFTQPGEVTSWAIYSNTTHQITPLILRADNTPEYTITGIGRTRTAGGTGEEEFDFDLQAGSGDVGPGYFLGWKDGSNGSDNAGVACFTNGTSDSVRWFERHTTFAVSDDLGSGTVLPRTYSLRATATSAAGPRPIAYWSFDEGAADLSGNGHEGTIHGAEPATDVPPALGAGRSLRFDGSNDYVSAAIDVSETSFTSSMWFKADSAGRGLLAVVDGDLGAGGHDRHVYLNGGDLAARVWNNETIRSSDRDYVDGQWHHVAHVVGEAVGGQRIYVDGELVAAGSKASSDFNWQKRLNIGFSNDAAQDYFDGLIDDVAVWDAALTEEGVRALAGGASPLALAGYGPLIAGDVQDAMQHVGASAYVRVPFDVTTPIDFNGLVLRMKHDDGFVAWLNGVEVARRNAPAAPAYDSTALADRPKADAIEYETIDLTAHLGLLQEGRNILAVQGLNDSADSDDFLVLPELVKVRADPDRYLLPPTPGQANVRGVVDFVADLSFSVERGFYTAGFDVAITTATPGATVVYTLDGREPTLTCGTQAVAPDAQTSPVGTVPVSATTMLRAAAFKEGYEPTDVTTHTYIFPADVVQQDVLWPTIVDHAEWGPRLAEALQALPTVSLVTSGAISQTEQETSIELIFPDGRAGVQANAGVEHYGGHSLGYPKKSMRISFKKAYGPAELRYDLFGDGAADEFDQILLRSGSHDTVFYTNTTRGVYIRNRWMADRQLEMGQPAPRGQYVHVYVNGTYWGQHHLMERPNAAFMASYFGGGKQDYDALNAGSAVDGDRTAWNAMVASAGDYQAVQEYMDLVNYADYMLLQFYGGNNWDWNHYQNWMAARKRESGAGYQFFAWDSDMVLRRGLNANVIDRGGPGNMWGGLKQHEEFRMLLADRAQKYFFNGGMLTSERVVAQWEELASRIETSIIAETARWGHQAGSDYTPDTWRANLQTVLTEIVCPSSGPDRTAVVIQQMRAAGVFPTIDAPAFSQYGGQVDPGFLLEISAAAGAIYYTLDGTDPRQVGGGVAPGARLYDGTPVEVGESGPVRARALEGQEWSALNEAAFFVHVPAAAGNLAITELNYNPYAPTPDELAVDPDFLKDDFEFIELTNVGAETIDLAGVQLSDAVELVVADGGGATLAPGGRVVVVANRGAFDARNGTDVPVAGQYERNLGNSGEMVTLTDRFGQTIHSFEYGSGDEWPGRANGKGSSLVVIDTAGDYSDGDNWRSSTEYGGSPGGAGIGRAVDVIVNEVLTHTDPPQVDAIELLNTTGAAVDISGWYLSDSSANYRKFRIPDGTILGGGEYRVFDESDFNPSGGADPSDFALNGAYGDDVWLLEADEDGRLARFADHVEFGAAANGESLGRWPDGTGGLYPMKALTLGGPNSAARVGPVVVSEIHYDPGDAENADDLKFVEVHNPTADTIDLTEWRVRGGVHFDFPDGATIGSGQTLVVLSFDPADAANADRLAAFRSAYGVYGPVRLIGGYSGDLGDAGGKVRLRRPDDPPVDEPDFIPRLLEDEVIYSDAPPWPDANGTGRSLHRRAARLWGNAPETWWAAQPTPGTAEFVARPAARDDAFWVVEDHTHAGTLPADKVDPADTLTYQIVTGPAHGVLTFFDPATGEYTYEPTGDFNGSDGFAFTVHDTYAGSGPAAVSVTVLPVNDAPQTTPAALETGEDSPVTVDLRTLVADKETPDADLTFAVGDAVDGSVRLIDGHLAEFVPLPDFAGAGGFAYTVADQDGLTGTGQVAITVTGINDEPVAQDDSFGIAEDHTLNGTTVFANDSDAHEGAPGESNLPLTAQIVRDPSHAAGFVLNPDGTFTYTPVENFNGADSFTYQAVDSLGGASGEATVAITVDPVNDPPRADAGPDLEVFDTDGDGYAPVSLDGWRSTDVEGIASYEWGENGVEIRTGADPSVDLPVARHWIVLTVTDDLGVTDTDEVAIDVWPSPSAGGPAILANPVAAGIHQRSHPYRIMWTGDGAPTLWTFGPTGLQIIAGPDDILASQRYHDWHVSDAAAGWFTFISQTDDGGVPTFSCSPGWVQVTGQGGQATAAQTMEAAPSGMGTPGAAEAGILTWLSPAGGDTVKQAQAFELCWEVDVPAGDSLTGSLWAFSAAGKQWPLVTGGLEVDSGRYVWDTTSVRPGQYCFGIQLDDGGSWTELIRSDWLEVL